jgi:microcystin-dependent protein
LITDSAGESTFALPDLRGRLPIHQGNGFILAETGGAEEITLTVSQIAAHSHPWLASEAGATALTPQGNVPAEASKRFYVAPSTTSAMAPQAVGATGGSQPHTNFQPYLCIDFIISLFGIFPSPT